MREQVSVMLTGHDVGYPLDAGAHAALRAYFDESAARLVGDPDRAEILEDIERSVGDRLSALPREQGDPVTADQMGAVLSAVGPVEGGYSGVPPEPIDAGSTTAAVGVARGRFLCRITEGQSVAGVCTGLAAYAQVPHDAVQWVFVLLAIFTGGLFALVYLVLVVVLQVVPTVADYERMRDSPRGSARPS